MTQDASSIASIVTALYECMSFDSCARPNYERFRELFCPGASIMPPSDDDIPVSAVSVEDFIETSLYALENSKELMARGLKEQEIHQHKLLFGSIAQIFSTYESRVVFEDRTAVGRGVNSISLVFQQQRWWILSLSWDDESAELELSSHLLP